MPRRTATEAARTRRRLLREGARYFARTRYGDARLEELVARMGVTRGALYHHFGSKRGYFEAVVESALQDLAEHIVEAAEAAGDGWRGLEAGCDAFLEAATDAKFREVVLIDAPAVLGWHGWKELDDRTTSQTLREGLEELRRAGRLETKDVDALSIALSGAMNELALWVAEQPERQKALAQAQRVVATMLRAVRPD